MYKKVFIVGRNPNVSQGEIAVKIDDPSKRVSSSHCRIIYDGGIFYIEDLISVNGTFVDGNKISSRTVVTPDNRITLGEKYVFSLSNPVIQSALLSSRENSEIKPDEGREKFSSSYETDNFSFEGIQKNKFFSFIQPLLDCIDDGCFFKNPVIWLYTISAVFSLLIPFILIVVSGIFSRYLSVKDVFALIIAWLFVAFGYWLVFQILWNRRKELKYLIKSHDEFKATPIIAHIVKTYGETNGVFLAVAGFGVSLVALLFYGRGNLNVLGFPSRGIGFFGSLFDSNFPIINLILFPILGYTVVVLSKFLSEFISVFTSIANNTKKIEK